MDVLLSQKLLAWYEKHYRRLPWRLDPQMRRCGGRPNPYHVWLSEIMLQQTTVATVKNYFGKFIALWPDMDALVQASLDDVLKAWAGLGYYSRARNLKACAEVVMLHHRGNMPQDYQSLRSLPGIGDYTACAILSIAFDMAYPAVDGNIERVVSRLFNITTPKPALKKQVRAKMLDIMPPIRAGDFIQALMDLGNLVCLPQKPDCAVCPLNENCLGNLQGNPSRLPFKPLKIQKKLRTGTAFVIRSTRGRIFLQKRPALGLLASMSEIPNHFGENASKQDIDKAPCCGKWRYQGEIVHIFTHFRLEMAVYLLTNVEETCCQNGWWVEEERLGSEALPTVMKKAIACAIAKA